MITGQLRSKIDRLWDAFCSGGISNPLEVIEQITYLMFIKRLDDMQTLKENKANRTGKPIENPVYTEDDPQELRWSVFTEMSPEGTYQVVADGVFPWLRRLGGEGSTYSHHMKDARFTIPTPNPTGLRWPRLPRWARSCCPGAIGAGHGALEGAIRSEQLRGQDLIHPLGEQVLLGDHHERPGALAEDAGVLGHASEEATLRPPTLAAVATSASKA